MKLQTREGVDMRNRTLILSIFSFSLAFAAVAQTPPPQRTMVSRPETTAPGDSSGASSAMAAAMERYREMWNKMSATQRQAFVNAGGSTPERYERSLKQRGNSFVADGEGAAQQTVERSRKTPDSGNPIDSNAFDSLSKSLQDLSSVRDGNLWRVQKDGCPPEIASRMADLRGKLETYELELNGAESAAPAGAGASSREKRGSTDRLAIAADWFKSPADKETSTPGSGAPGGNSRESKLLDAALAGNGSAVAPESRIAPKSAETERTRKAAEQDIARIKGELAQLSGACTAPKK
jgi:hypothetical protein